MVLTTVTAFAHNLFFGLAGLIGISFVVAFHEFGHFIFCKLFKIKTPSFSIGFGPRLLKKKIGDTEFAISAIPLGGYVEIANSPEETGTLPQEPINEEEYFRNKPWIQQFAVMIGGIAFNILLAYIICAILFMAGMPASPILYPANANATIDSIRKESPADKAGLQLNDRVIAFNGRTITDANAPEMVEEIINSPGKSATVRIARSSASATQPTEFDVTLDIQPKDFLGKIIGTTGATFNMHSMEGFGIGQSIVSGICIANKLMYDSIIGLKYIFSSGDTSKVTGPVGLISATMGGAKKGIKTFLLFLAYISVSLAILNLLPLPILDGGQIVFYTIEALAGRPIPDRIREYIHIGCWVLFMILVVFLTYNDLKCILSPYFEDIRKFFGK